MDKFETEEFTKEGQRLIKQAVIAAGELGHTYVGTEHLLLGAASLDRCAASAVLLKFSLLPSVIQAQIAVRAAIMAMKARSRVRVGCAVLVTADISNLLFLLE